MRPSAFLLLFPLVLAACEDKPDFTEVQKKDTIEAYEDYEKADPDGIYQGQIDLRLEELYYEKAQADGTADSWKAYATKFPDGKHKRDADKALEDLAWDAATAANTPDAYRQFLTDYPKGDKRHRLTAQGVVDVADYGKLTVGAPTVTQVNLAEDPKGAPDGWGVSADVTNGGDKDLEYVNISVDWLAADGSLIERDQRPLTSKTWTMPATDLEQQPLKAGETRAWKYTIGFDKAPADKPPTAKVTATGLRPVGAAATP